MCAPILAFLVVGLLSSSAQAADVLANHPPVQRRGEQGVHLAGLRIATSPSVVLENCRGVVIEGCDLRSVRLVNCTDVRVVNSFIHDAPAVGVELDESRSVLIQGNRIERVASGVYAHRSSGVRVVGNLCRDVQGPMPRGQMVQFDKVTGPGNEVAYNHALNRTGQSQPEDVVSVYQSQGTADSPIDIHHNILLGDPRRGSTDKSASGSGIMLGDGGGRHQRARHNVLLSPGQVGIGVAGGADITVERNAVRGDRSNISNVGIYTWNQYPNARAGEVTVANNHVHWTSAKGQPNDFWDGGGFTKVTRRDNRWRSDWLGGIEPRTVIDETTPPKPYGESPAEPWLTGTNPAD